MRAGSTRAGSRYGWSLSITSSSVGNLPSRSFEKISRPSTVTSKAPPWPFSSSVSTPNSSFSTAARLAARGR